MEKGNKMGVTPIGKLLVEVSVPIMISMFIQALYNVVDSFFVSKLNEQAFTAVSLAFPIQNTIIGIGVGTGVGMNALFSRSLGEENKHQASLAAENGIILTLIYAIIFFLIGKFGSVSYYMSQTSDPLIIDYGKEYMSIVCMLSIGIFMQITMERLIQATGRSILTMIMQIIGACTNMILDPILIFGLFGFPEMGVAGAAVATVTGQLLAGTLGIIFERKYNKEVEIKKLRWDLKTIGKIYSVGIPSMILISLTGFTVYLFNKILSKFSNTALAAYGAYFKMQSFVFMPAFGLVNGMVPILAYNYGAHESERANQTVRYSLVSGTIIMLIGFLIFQIFPAELLRVFNASEELMEIGVPALRIISISFIFAGVTVVSSSVFQALGNGMLSLCTTFIRLIIVLLPAAYLLSLKGELNLVWWSYPIAEGCDMLACVYFLKTFAKRKINELA